MTDVAPEIQAEPNRLIVEYRPIDSLFGHERNARTHSKTQIKQIAQSIKEFGWTTPILLDGDSTILAGHGRLAAAKSLKMKTVPVIDLQGLSDAQKRAYMIADNQMAIEAGWDSEVLAGELNDLKLAEFDLGLLGFEDVEAVMKAVETQTPKTDEASLEEEKGSRGAGATRLQYNLIFETEAQRKNWFDFVRKIKGQYPDTETLGERLFRFLTEGGHVVAR